jgi:hypothetical protein
MSWENSDKTSNSRMLAARRTGAGKIALCLTLIFTWSVAGRHAAAMFVTRPTEKSPAASPAEKSEASESNPNVLPDGTSPEDIELGKHISEMSTPPAEKRKVNSNTFARMSGETEEFKQVVIPSAAVQRVKASRLPSTSVDDSQEKLLGIGTWVFISVCIAATAIALFRIKKLASSG